MSILNTDLYQLTMSYILWRMAGKNFSSRKAVSYYHFRSAPFQGNYAIFCGKSYWKEYLKSLIPTEQEKNYLKTLRSPDGNGLLFQDQSFFDEVFHENEVSYYGFEDGDVVFPYEPIVRLEGPFHQILLQETPFLATMNYMTFVATKAARITYASGNIPWIELGSRRAFGPEAAVSGAYAAYIGGAQGTSNLLAGMKYDIPVFGTTAHAYYQSQIALNSHLSPIEAEEKAMLSAAKSMPNNVVHLTDTIHTQIGIDNAIKAIKEAKTLGIITRGVRIDCDPISDIAKEYRQKLDENSLENVQIFATNDLDEYKIYDLKEAQTPVNVYGVGTSVLTGGGSKPLGGVLKLSSIEGNKCMKISNNSVKSTLPGILETRRIYKRVDNQEVPVADIVIDINDNPPSNSSSWMAFNIKDSNDFRLISSDNIKSQFNKWTDSTASAQELRKRSINLRNKFEDSLFHLDQTTDDSSSYFVGVEKNLYESKLNYMFSVKKSEKAI